MHSLKKISTVLLAAGMLVLTACGDSAAAPEENIVTTPAPQEASDQEARPDAYPDAHKVVLNADGSVTFDGEAVEEFDYVWHADPSEDHGQVKNSPAEFFTGTEPETDSALYIARDIYYYPQLDESGFTKVEYDGETEWCYYYTAEEYQDYVFATLPVRNEFPAQMMHSEEEAYANPVLHITQPGEYILEGEWKGQILIDLGDEDETFADENSRAAIILNGVDVSCSVAPALIFRSAYECDNAWEERDEYSADVDISDAGARVIVCDGTENNFSGTNVYRMLKTKFKNEDESYRGQAQKKARKTDAAFYSYVSMTIDAEADGSGILNINSGFEGLDSELHLAINGGRINIFSQDDGINVNEDGVSVVQFNGGEVHILGGLGSEGDGVDSNGFLVVNGGCVIASANPRSDSGLDSDCGSYIYGGTVLALGSTMDWAESDGSDSTQAVMNLCFSSCENADEEIEILDADGNTVFFYEPEDDAVVGGNARQYMGAVISAPELEVGNTYSIYVGGIQQGYGSAGEPGAFGRPGEFGEPKPGEQRPDFDPSQKPDFGSGQRGFGGQTPPAMPDGQTPPEMPDGQTPPEMSGGQGGFGHGPAWGESESGPLSADFILEDTVNGFSGVRDYSREDE